MVSTLTHVSFSIVTANSHQQSVFTPTDGALIRQTDHMGPFIYTYYKPSGEQSSNSSSQKRKRLLSSYTSSKNVKSHTQKYFPKEKVREIQTNNRRHNRYI